MLLASGCASSQWDAETEGAYDPLEPINRGSYRVHKVVDGALLKPLASAYDQTPLVFRTAMGNVYDNLGEPANMVNNALQKNGDGAGSSLARFGINSTFGLAGLFDAAAHIGLKRQPADFGQTLRGYGAENSAYLFLPLLGPTTVADGVGTGVDAFMSPVTYLDDERTRWIIGGAQAIHRRAELLNATDLAESAALDEYAFIRDAYEDRRRANAPKNLWRGK